MKKASDFLRGKADDVSCYTDDLSRYIRDIQELRKFYCKNWSRNQAYDLKNALAHLKEARRYMSTLMNSCSCDSYNAHRKYSQLREHIQMQHHIERNNFDTSDFLLDEEIHS